jgi:hypothetical protein
MSGITRRERIDSVTGPGTCGASCHGTHINPAGFPLESFDDLGRYRTEDNGQPVDLAAAIKLGGQLVSYDGPIEWAQTLAESHEAHACYVKHWLEFGYGRQTQDADEGLISSLAERSRMDDLPVKELLALLATAPGFRTRLPEAS